jgi:hypothetical protein
VLTLLALIVAGGGLALAVVVLHSSAGRAPFSVREPYAAALRHSDAGVIELEEGDRAGTVRRLLHEAARELGTEVQDRWADSHHRVLLWKKLDRNARFGGGL